MPATPEQKNIANKVLSLVVTGYNLAENWGFYMFDEDFRYEPELRSKIGALWLGALYDCLEAETRGHIDRLETEATANEYRNMVMFCQRAREFNEIVTEVLGMYSKEEQLAIQDLRDQFVHSWLHKKFQNSFRVKYVKGNELVFEVISREAYFDLIRPLAEKGPDDEMKSILERFLNKELRYWKDSIVSIAQLFTKCRRRNFC